MGVLLMDAGLDLMWACQISQRNVVVPHVLVMILTLEDPHRDGLGNLWGPSLHVAAHRVIYHYRVVEGFRCRTQLNMSTSDFTEDCGTSHSCDDFEGPAQRDSLGKSVGHFCSPSLHVAAHRVYIALPAPYILDYFS